MSSLIKSLLKSTYLHDNVFFEELIINGPLISLFLRALSSKVGRHHNFRKILTLDSILSNLRNVYIFTLQQVSF